MRILINFNFDGPFYKEHAAKCYKNVLANFKNPSIPEVLNGGTEKACVKERGMYLHHNIIYSRYIYNLIPPDYTIVITNPHAFSFKNQLVKIKLSQ